jgi:hypothetical protein
MGVSGDVVDLRHELGWAFLTDTYDVEPVGDSLAFPEPKKISLRRATP